MEIGDEETSIIWYHDQGSWFNNDRSRFIFYLQWTPWMDGMEREVSRKQIG